MWDPALSQSTSYSNRSDEVFTPSDSKPRIVLRKLLPDLKILRLQLSLKGCIQVQHIIEWFSTKQNAGSLLSIGRKILLMGYLKRGTEKSVSRCYIQISVWSQCRRCSSPPEPGICILCLPQNQELVWRHFRREGFGTSQGRGTDSLKNRSRK